MNNKIQYHDFSQSESQLSISEPEFPVIEWLSLKVTCFYKNKKLET